jgi:N-methylhydantoinase B
VPDSGGPGRFRGGLSVAKRYRFLDAASIMVRTMRPMSGGPGLAGGGAGAPSTNLLMSDGDVLELPRDSHIHLELKPGDRLHHETGGAGGHGHEGEPR